MLEMLLARFGVPADLVVREREAEPDRQHLQQGGEGRGVKEEEGRGEGGGEGRGVKEEEGRGEGGGEGRAVKEEEGAPAGDIPRLD